MTASILKGVSDEFVVTERIKVWQSSSENTLVPCKFRFKRPNREQLTELSESLTAALSKTNLNRVSEILREYLLGWEINGANGQPVEFNDDNVNIVLDHPDYLNGVIDAFTKVLNPGAGRRKN